MRPWELAVDLDDGKEQPIFLQIAHALADDIRRGRLRPGALLPGSRALAGSLSVHRNTVLAAYRELGAEGWIETVPAQGTRVSSSLPDRPARRFSARAGTRSEVPSRLGFDLGPGPAPYPLARFPKGTLVLSGGIPDLGLVPVTALARAYRRALSSEAKGRADGRRGPQSLDYGEPHGHPRLREALASMLSSVRGLAASAGHVLVTRGSQMALDLVARALFSPGDVVAVEAFGYRPAWEAFTRAGARLVPLPVDEQGLAVSALDALLAREKVRAVYVTPHHQYPSTAVLSAGRRLALLDLARAHRLAILEDDYDHEFHYEGRPVLPLASADPHGVVVYLGTLSKILAPGLRIGFVVAPPPLVEHLAAIRTYVDRQGDLTVERAVAELLEDGEVQRHARRARRAYHTRRDALAEALGRELGEALSFHVPVGGMALWARVAPSIDVDAWAERGLAEGVAFATGKRFAFDGRRHPFVRLGFATLGERELREAVKRMARALR
ncbi:MAG: PLP-dependent aminotransferase family protein [Byssovorax sp.]